MYSISVTSISLVKLTFGLMTFGVFITSFLVIVYGKLLPKILVDIVKYGKLEDKNPSPFIIMVPKSWFRHFYIIGVICTGMALMLTIKVCLFGETPPKLFISLLDVLTSNKRIPSGTAVCTIMGISMLFVHCIVRLLETLFISVYSKSNINIVHYVCGIIHYVGSAVAIVTESPGFSQSKRCYFSLDELTGFECCSVLLYCLASYEQLKSSIILANLRKNRIGTVYTYKHLIPTGRFFNVLSTPHIVAEIFIYISITFILRSNQTWWFIFMWVLTNQCAAAWMNHTWYKDNFPNYPKERRALIPYLF